jgi:cell division protease FtsH
MQVPTEDRFLLRKTELNNRIATLLGGRAAEEIVIFNDISTGAQNDLSRATDIARSMVKRVRHERARGAGVLREPAAAGVSGCNG